MITKPFSVASLFLNFADFAGVYQTTLPIHFAHFFDYSEVPVYFFPTTRAA